MLQAVLSTLIPIFNRIINLLESFNNSCPLLLQKLLPIWSALIDPSASLGDKINVWFWLILLSVFTTATLWFGVYRRVRLRFRFLWLRKRLKQLRRANPDKIDEQLTLITEQAEKKKSPAGYALREFCCNLVEVDEGKRRTDDAENYLSPATIAPEIIGNRLLTAIPGILTAIGVLGTFLGLQLGLSDLNIAGDADVAQMKTGVAGVITGARVAFTTSVWGVFLSILFNLGEKSFEGGIVKRVLPLQSLLNRAIPLLTAEEQLQNIARDGNESRQSLQGLAEQIGSKMQESLGQISIDIRESIKQVSTDVQQGVSDGFKEVLGPALENINRSSDSALQGLLSHFTERFGEMGQEQRAAIDAANTRLGQTLGEMNTSFSSFSSDIETLRETGKEREAALTQTVQDISTEIKEAASQQSESLSETTNKLMRDLRKSLTDTISIVTNNVNNTFSSMESRSNTMEEQRNQQFQEQITHFSSTIESLIANTIDNAGNLNSRTQQTMESFTTLLAAKTAEINDTTDAMLKALQENLQTTLRDTSEGMQQLIHGQEEHSRQRTQYQQEQDEARYQRIDEILNSTGEAVANTATALQNILTRIEQQNNLVTPLLQQAKELQQQVNNSTIEQQVVAKAFRDASKNAKQAAEQSDNATSNFLETAQKINNAGVGFQKATDNLSQLHDKLGEGATLIERISSELREIITQTATTFTSLKDTQQEFLEKQEAGIEQTTVKINNLFNEFNGQVNDGLNEALQKFSAAHTDYATHLSTYAQEIGESVALLAAANNQH